MRGSWLKMFWSFAAKTNDCTSKEWDSFVGRRNKDGGKIKVNAGGGPLWVKTYWSLSQEGRIVMIIEGFTWLTSNWGWEYLFDSQ